MDNIKAWWHKFYNGSTPVSYLLRQQIAERWFRIHSLPESKRYAETPEEKATILQRHNQIATEIMGSSSCCILFLGQHTQKAELKMIATKVSQLDDLNFELFETVDDSDEDWDGPQYINIWFTEVVWSPHCFNQIIHAVADDQVRHVLFVSVKTGEAYAPYDGGGDLFLRSIARRKALKACYQEWLSQHPAGL